MSYVVGHDGEKADPNVCEDEWHQRSSDSANETGWISGNGCRLLYLKF